MIPPAAPGFALLLASLLAEEPRLSGASAQKPDRDPAEKPLWKKAKASGVDKKLKVIDVKDPSLEVVWDPVTTTFHHHRTLLLRDLPEGSMIHILGKIHEERGGPEGKNQAAPGKKYGAAEALLSDIEHIGTGKAYKQPPLVGKTGFIRWHAAELRSTRLPFFARVQNRTYKLVTDERATVLSTAKLDPEAIVGKTVWLGGRARKVTVERDGKERQVTRMVVTDVHVVDVSAEHMKVFLAQWGDRKLVEASKDAEKDFQEGKVPKDAKAAPRSFR